MIVVFGLIIAFILMILFTNRKTRICRWREYPGAEQSTWRCAYCGAETAGPRGRPPATCLRGHGTGR